MSRAGTAALVAKTLGPGWVVERSRYEVRKRSGWLKRQLPTMAWEDTPLAAWIDDAKPHAPETYLEYRRTRAPRFFFAPEARAAYAPLLRSFDQGDEDGPVEIANRIVDGTFRYFSHLDVAQGTLPNWHRNAITGEEAPSDRHWTEIGDFGFGDIKVIWELSRFGWAFDLVRAYWRTGDERYPERFWQLLEHWRGQNPPNLGPNWKCGQETSLRVMAWCFALYGFMGSPATTADRVSMLAQMVAFSGRRIETTLGYALSQRNNHGVSEGMGLWTIGALFPEFREAGRWRGKGRAVLESLAQSLIYDDGAFSQHSTNYHRVMLHDYVWSLRLGEILDQPFSETLLERFEKATDLIYQLQIDDGGRVPNYGANDGALILPLSTTAFEDYRPAIGAARYLVSRSRAYEAGPWDEDLLWLFGPSALAEERSASSRRSISTGSGYVTLRSEASMLFNRIPPMFRDRPSHADVLGVDLWWNGINIALDPGTYSYNAPAPWRNGLEATSVHNTITVDGMDQMAKAGRFMWAPWLQARLNCYLESSQGYASYIESSHNGYHRLSDPVTHARAIVRVGRDHWLIADRLGGHELHKYGLQWLLADGFVPLEQGATGSRLVLDTTFGDYGVQFGASDRSVEVHVVRAADECVRGWYSTRYYELRPAVSALTEVTASHVLFWTIFGPGAMRAEYNDNRIAVATQECRFVAEWGKHRIISHLSVTNHDGTVIDALETV